MALWFMLILFTAITPLYGLHLIEVKEHVEIPDPQEAAKVARYVIHNSDWASLATISTLPEIKTYPFVSLESISDGPRDNSTGMLYFYLTPLDMSSLDIK
ncbi:hypothetical protein ILUMI_06478, partial [Ignelater luminosus]